jgi:hypothetical protein
LDDRSVANDPSTIDLEFEAACCEGTAGSKDIAVVGGMQSYYESLCRNLSVVSESDVSGGVTRKVEPLQFGGKRNKDVELLARLLQFILLDLISPLRLAGCIDDEPTAVHSAVTLDIGIYEGNILSDIGPVTPDGECIDNFIGFWLAVCECD